MSRWSAGRRQRSAAKPNRKQVRFRVRLERRLEVRGTDWSGRRSEPLRGCSSGPRTRLSRDRLQGSRRLTSGCGAAAVSPSPGLPAVRIPTDAVGVPCFALAGTSGDPRSSHGLGVQGPGARPLRTSERIWDSPFYGSQGRARRGARRLLRPQPLHRLVQLRVRSGLEARDVNHVPHREWRILLQLLAHARQHVAGVSEQSAPGGQRQALPHLGRRARGDTGSAVGGSRAPRLQSGKPGRRGSTKRNMDALFMQFLANDKFCPTQR